MRRKKSSEDYEVGYGKPPKATQFSSENQPRNYKRSSCSILAISKKKVGSGSGPETTLGEAAILALIQRAFNGVPVLGQEEVGPSGKPKKKPPKVDYEARRELYRLLDAEEDAAAVQTPPASMSKRVQEQVADRLQSIARKQFDTLGMLLELGMLEMRLGRLVVSERLRGACARRDAAAKM